ncbi:MAG: COR domain-containing protein, partial [Anaerolineales bacterium]|nr:COR domain-containing protein [Anaerolineales bacterium]
AKILVVATHGGPQQRQPDIDRQELWDLFGRETVADFFFVDSKPDAHGHRKGIEELKLAIARLAAELPEVGRSVPKSFQDVREALQARSVPYLPLDEVLAICRAHKMDDEIARLFITISHRLGHLTHYQHDPALRDIVILRPDWLATAISYIFDDEVTRAAHGLVRFSRLNHLWDDPTRPADTRYPDSLHRIFIALMGRFDLSYRVADSTPRGESDPQYLIAQLVPDNRPENFGSAWISSPSSGDLQQTQICRIVDDKGNTATAEGLFYQLIVRLHKYSLGRAAYADSVHWQRGLILDDDYNGRALLEHKGNDVHITVRAPYPERFLAMLTEEVRYLVESFWEGLRCEITVPCLNPIPCFGLLEVRKLIESKQKNRHEHPCPICNEWQDIETLLRNAPAASKPISIEVLERQLSSIENKLDTVDVNVRRIRSQADKNFDDLIRIFTDEAKEGPRLFSLFPLDRSHFNPKNWIREKFRLVLWCEHSRLPLPALNGEKSKKGVYDLDLDREWFKKSAPYLKLLTGTLGMVLPVASSAVKIALDKTAYELIEEQLNFGKSIIDATLGEATKIGEFMGAADSSTLDHGVAIRGDGATLREFHTLLKAVDKAEKFGGLVRVMNKRQEFL